MPSSNTKDLIVVVVEFRLAVHDLPFKTWKELKDRARASLTNGHEPGGTEMSQASADGRSVGYVMCKCSEDAHMIYHGMLRFINYGIKVHWYNTRKSPSLVDCNCPGGPQSTDHRYDYRNYAWMVESYDPRHQVIPVAYSQPNYLSPVDALTSSMGSVNLSPRDYYAPSIHQPVQYAAPPTATYAYPVTSAPDYAMPASTAPPYPQYVYPAGYAMTSQAYQQPGPVQTAYAENWQHSSGYTQVPGYPPQASATAGYGQASASASYALNASDLMVNTTQGYISTERNTLIMRNLDWKTTEADVKKEVCRVVEPIAVKLNKYEHLKKKSITATITFNNFREVKAVKEHFDKKTRHIKNREVYVQFGKDSVPTKPPMVISSDTA